MGYEVKKKVFTTFFTTKGLGGTGLGLLMTKKIIQKGICIKCATAEAARTSYLCDDCQSLDRMEDIRSELAALRRDILKEQSDREAGQWPISF
jgi:hypothetical protein